MRINYWRNYPRRKPKEDGFYLCTIDMGGGIHVVKQLWYNARTGSWINKERLSVFEGYAVFKHCRATIEENHVYTDSLCDRTEDIVHWRMLPKVKRKRKGNN